MTNAELIAALRYRTIIPYTSCRGCPIYTSEGGCIDKMHKCAADALEAAERLITELSLDNKMLKNTIDADKGVMLDQIRFLETQLPKECEIKRHADKIPNARNRYCTRCGAYLSDEEFGNHTVRYCYWCGSKVKGEQNG